MFAVNFSSRRVSYYLVGLVVQNRERTVVMMSVNSHITMKSFTPTYHLNLIIYWKLSSTAKASSDWGIRFKLCSTENWYLILWWNCHCLRLYVRKSKEHIRMKDFKKIDGFWLYGILFRQITSHLNAKVLQSLLGFKNWKIYYIGVVSNLISCHVLSAGAANVSSFFASQKKVCCT